MNPIGMFFNRNTGPPTQQQRVQWFQTIGFLFITVLIILDNVSRNATASRRVVTVVNPREEAPQVPSDYENVRVDVDKLVSLKRSLSRDIYGQNVSGIYLGSWADHSSERYDNKSSFGGGNVAIQLKALDSGDIPGIDFVYGLATIFHIDKFGDITYPLQGMYVRATGELALFTTLLKTQKLYLHVPRSGEPLHFDPPLSPSLNATDLSRFKKEVAHDKNSSVQAVEITEPDFGDFRVGAQGMNNGNGKSKEEKDKENSKEVLSSVAASLLRFDFNNALFQLLTARIRAYGDMWTTLRSRAAFAMAHRFGVAKKAAWLELSSHSVKSDTTSEWHVNDFVASRSTPVPEYPLEEYELMEEQYAPRMLKESSFESKYMSYTSKVGFDLVLVDTAQSSVDIKKQRLMPFGAKILPVSFMHYQLDRSKLRSELMEPWRFHFLPRSKNIESLDESIFLPSCTFSLGLQSTRLNDDTVAEKTGDEKVKVSDDDKRKYVANVKGALESETCERSFNISLMSLDAERELIETKVTEYSAIEAMLSVIQIVLLVVQMRYSSSPASTSKMSIVAMALNAITDAVCCVSHVLLSALLSKALSYSYIVIISFLQLIIFGILELRMVMKILIARQGSSSEGSAEIRRRLGTLNVRFFIAFFVFTMIFFNFLESPLFLVFVFYSMWVPQIAFNVYTGMRRALHPQFLIGTTLCRLFVPLYFLGCPRNFLKVMSSQSVSHVANTDAACVTLVVWCAIQVGVLLLQDRFGARFFVPKSWLPQKYDYSRPWVPRQHEHHEGHGNPTPDIESGNLHECIICYNGIENVPDGYMLTPCDHCFHKHCLTQWMAVKLECPVCRAVLPPVDDASDEMPQLQSSGAD